MIGGCRVNLLHDHVEESEEEYIPPPLLHTHPIPHIGDHYFSLFDDILTPPPCDLHCNHLLLKAGQIDNISPEMEEVVHEGVRR